MSVQTLTSFPTPRQARQLHALPMFQHDGRPSKTRTRRRTDSGPADGAASEVANPQVEPCVAALLCIAACVG